MNSTTSTNNRSKRHLLTIVGMAILLPAILLVGCVSITTDGNNGEGAVDESQKHTFAVGENPTIDVSGFNGSIEIITGADEEVDVEATLRIPGRISYSAVVEGNTVTVVAKKTGSGISIGSSPRAEIFIVVPVRSNIKLDNSNGELIVTGVVGDGELETSNGRITLTNVVGSYESSTSNGSVKMTDVSGEFEVETSNGKIEFSGDFDANSDNSFDSSNGSISVVFNNDPNLNLDARTSNGSVDSKRPILVTTTKKSELKGTYGDGSATLDIRTSNGSIDIR